MSNAQLLTLVVGVIGFFLAVGFLKKTAKLIVGIAIVLVAGMLYFGLEPKQVLDTAVLIKDKGMEFVENLASVSNAIKLEGDKIYIKADDTWIDVNAITSVSSIVSEGYAKVKVDDTEYEVYDTEVIKLLKTLLSY